MNISQRAVMEARDTKKKIRLRVGDQIVFADVAFAPRDLEDGLRNRESLANEEGMLFVLGANPQDAAFWMKGMKIPELEILFLDAIGIVLSKSTMTTQNDTQLHRAHAASAYALEVLPTVGEAVDIGDQVKFI